MKQSQQRENVILAFKNMSLSRQPKMSAELNRKGEWVKYEH